MANLVLGEPETLGDLTGTIIKIYNSPEILRNKNRNDVLQLPDGSISDYLVTGLAGYRIVAIEVVIDTSNQGSSILSNKQGINSYELSDGEGYFIQSVDMKRDTIAIITLVSNQKVLSDPDNPAVDVPDVFFSITPAGEAEYVLTGLVKESDIVFSVSTFDNQGEIGVKAHITFQVYRHSDDDIFINRLLWRDPFFDPWINPETIDFKVEQSYLKNGVIETETWSPGNSADTPVITFDRVRFAMNNAGISKEIVEYTIDNYDGSYSFLREFSETEVPEVIREPFTFPEPLPDPRASLADDGFLMTSWHYPDSEHIHNYTHQSNWSGIVCERPDNTMLMITIRIAPIAGEYMIEATGSPAIIDLTPLSLTVGEKYKIQVVSNMMEHDALDGWSYTLHLIPDPLPEVIPDQVIPEVELDQFPYYTLGVCRSYDGIIFYDDWITESACKYRFGESSMWTPNRD